MAPKRGENKYSSILLVAWQPLGSEEIPFYSTRHMAEQGAEYMIQGLGPPTMLMASGPPPRWVPPPVGVVWCCGCGVCGVVLWLGAAAADAGGGAAAVGELSDDDGGGGDDDDDLWSSPGAPQSHATHATPTAPHHTHRGGDPSRGGPMPSA